MTQAKAYSPTHITGFFAIYENGSTGAGVNLQEGMITTVNVKKNKSTAIEIKINGKKDHAETSRKVIEKYLEKTKEKHSILVSHKTKCPIGYGLGVSGSGALSLSIALNKTLQTKLTKTQILEIAKQAEIEAGTGLGDVVAEQLHGILVGLPPFPSTKAKIIKSKKKFVVCGFFAPIKTKDIIRDENHKKKINEAGLYCMEKILEKTTQENFVEQSIYFTLNSGLATKEVLKVMEKIPKTSQSMLGSTTFTITDNPSKVKKELKKYCKRILVSKIAEHGARLL